MDLRPQILPSLLNHRLPGFEAPAGAVLPHYDGLALNNIPGAVCRWLGVPGFGTPPLDERIQSRWNAPYQHVILVLVDGLGLDLLEKAVQEDKYGLFWRQLAAGSVFAPLTSIAPSTTAAALTSLWTGLPPAAHGITGYEMWLKEYGMVINAITHSAVSYQNDPGGLRRAGFVPETFLNLPTLGTHLAAQGVQPFAFHHLAIYRSTFSAMLLGGVKNIPYRTLPDLWASAGSLLAANANRRTYTYIYWGDLDDTAHRNGPDNERVELEMENFSHLLEGFLTRLRRQNVGRTLLVVMADHGQVGTPRRDDLDIARRADFMNLLALPPSGEHRFTYLHVRSGREDQLAGLFASAWPGEFNLYASPAMLQAGLFGSGPRHPGILDRIGDQVALANGSAYLWWSDRENSLLGRHGGLSAAEMLVPLLALEV